MQTESFIEEDYFTQLWNLIKKCTNIVNAFHGRSINFPWRFLNTKACSCYCYSYRFGWAQREVMHNSSSHKRHDMHGQPVMRGIDWIMVNRDHFNIDIWGWTKTIRFFISYVISNETHRWWYPILIFIPNFARWRMRRFYPCPRGSQGRTFAWRAWTIRNEHLGRGRN